MKIKNLLLMALVATVSYGCATQQQFSDKVINNLTLETITKSKCQPSGFWSVPVMGTSTSVVDYQTCVGVDKLLMIIVDSTKSKKIDEAIADLIKMRYVHFLNTAERENKKWSSVKIKTEIVDPADSPTGRTTHVNYYSISSSPIE